jgi:serine protease inhibitor
MKMNVFRPSIRHLAFSFFCLAAFPVLTGTAAGQVRLARANTAFAFDLLRQVVVEQPRGNLFISPYSVSSVLQMVGEGARGETKTEIENTLHLGHGDAVAADWKALNQSLIGGQAGVSLSQASSIWYTDSIRPRPDFLARCTDLFGAKTGSLNFADPQSAKIINDWAARNTFGRIKDVVSWPIDPHTRVILANAIYFKGRWAVEFDRKATANHNFTRLDNTSAPVPMMRRRGHFDYFQAPGFQAVRLPYVGGRLQMYLFLPVVSSGVRQLLGGFDGGSWQNRILPQFRSHDGTVMLPRFTFKFAVTLNQALAALGMPGAFTSSADFSAMADGAVQLSEITQNSFVELNEEGTEAAAVTMGRMHATAVRPEERPFELILDRPFFFVIADEHTGTILFEGLMRDPS